MSTTHIVTEIESRAKNAHITMAEVFQRSGVASSTFGRWKKGKTNPNYTSVEKIRDALDAVEKESKH